MIKQSAFFQHVNSDMQLSISNEKLPIPKRKTQFQMRYYAIISFFMLLFLFSISIPPNVHRIMNLYVHRLILLWNDWPLQAPRWETSPNNTHSRELKHIFHSAFKRSLYSVVVAVLFRGCVHERMICVGGRVNENHMFNSHHKHCFTVRRALFCYYC